MGALPMSSAPEPGRPPASSDQENADRRGWRVLLVLISLGFLVGIGVLVTAVWLDWQ